jgi:RNA polymerase sigma-70 factor (ECF subfamily)
VSKFTERARVGVTGAYVSDRELVAKAKRGDREAFGELVLRHQQQVYHMALRVVRNTQDAEDVAQDAFVSAYEKLRTFRGSSSFRTWVISIALNRARNLLRDNPAERNEELPVSAQAATADPLQALEGKEGQELLARAIDALPPKQRMTVLLRVQEDMSHKQIARALGTSPGTSKANYHFAVERLREVMERHELCKV